MSDAATGAVALSVSPTKSVDGALAAWRVETDRRRSTFQAIAVAHNAEQAVRRARLLRRIVGASAVMGVLGGALAYPWLGGTVVASIAPPMASVVPSIDDPGSMLLPGRVEEPVVPLQLESQVLAWQADGSYWLQFDYAGSDMTLHWFDASGREVLESTGCSNRISSGLSRCYVGRTASRVDLARDAGATMGTWTVSACQAGRCETVANYDVR